MIVIRTNSYNNKNKTFLQVNGKEVLSDDILNEMYFCNIPDAKNNYYPMFNPLSNIKIMIGKPAQTYHAIIDKITNKFKDVNLDIVETCIYEFEEYLRLNGILNIQFVLKKIEEGHLLFKYENKLCYFPSVLFYTTLYKLLSNKPTLCLINTTLLSNKNVREAIYKKIYINDLSNLNAIYKCTDNNMYYFKLNDKTIQYRTLPNDAKQQMINSISEQNLIPIRNIDKIQEESINMVDGLFRRCIVCGKECTTNISKCPSCGEFLLIQDINYQANEFLSKYGVSTIQSIFKDNQYIYVKVDDEKYLYGIKIIDNLIFVKSITKQYYAIGYDIFSFDDIAYINKVETVYEGIRTIYPEFIFKPGRPIKKIVFENLFIDETKAADKYCVEFINNNNLKFDSLVNIDLSHSGRINYVSEYLGIKLIIKEKAKVKTEDNYNPYQIFAPSKEKVIASVLNDDNNEIINKVRKVQLKCPLCDGTDFEENSTSYICNFCGEEISKEKKPC